MVFCPKCGKDNPNDAAFCDKCGGNLSSYQPMPQVPTPPPLYTPQLKRKSKLPWILAAVAILIVIMLIIAASLTNSGDDDPALGSTRENAAPVGTPITMSFDEWTGDEKYRITVTDVLEGYEADALVSIFGSVPEGYDYFAVKIKCEYVEGDEWLMPETDFDLFTDGLISCEKEYFLDSSVTDWPTSLLEGGNFEGYIVYIVPEGNSPLWLRWDYNMFIDEGDMIWYKVR